MVSSRITWLGACREWIASGHARLSRHGGAAVPQRGGVTAGRAGGDARTGTEHLWSTTTAPTAPPRWRVGTARTWSPRPGRAMARRCTPGSWRRRRRSWRSSTPTAHWTRAICRNWSTTSNAVPIWRSDVGAPSRDCSGRGMPGRAPRRCAGGCVRSTACPCTTSRRCGWCAETRCLRLGVEDRRSGYPLELLVRAAARGLAGRRARRGLRSADRREIEGQRFAARQCGCGHGLLAGDFVIPVVALVVAKAPVPGLAKTRLAASIGDRAAADIAAAALLDTLDAVAAAPVQARVVAMTGDLDAACASRRNPQSPRRVHRRPAARRRFRRSARQRTCRRRGSGRQPKRCSRSAWTPRR